MGKTLIMKILDNEMPLPEIAKTLGAKVDKIEPDQGKLSMKYELDQGFTNPAGFIQGGILASMLDDTMSLALLSTITDDLLALSLELKTNFILPAFPGKFIGHGKVISNGNRICVLEGDLWQNKKRVARASATVLVTKKYRHENR